jgi:hypothetical protein
MFINAQADSKAYVAATNLFREQETNPLSAQYVWEPLAHLADLDTGTFNYPSAVGLAMAGYAHFSIWFELTAVAGGTLTLQVQGSMNDVTPTFLNYTAAGYLVTNPGGGGLATYGTPVGGSLNGHLDFDWLNTKFVRVQIVASNDNNTVVRLYIRRRAL